MTVASARLTVKRPLRWDETCLNCAVDCGNAVAGTCDGPCGNGACGSGETPQSCPEDCGGDWECGDGAVTLVRPARTAAPTAASAQIAETAPARL